jgi:prevent-host-death family protein
VSVYLIRSRCYFQHMASIGLRELRQRASEFLRKVEAGQTIEITSRGRPIALLVPLRGSSRVERLVREGRVTPPRGDLLALGAPLRPRRGERPSAALMRARVSVVAHADGGDGTYRPRSSQASRAMRPMSW